MLLPLFMIGCAVNQKITYNTKDLVHDPAVPIPAKVEIRLLEDNRKNVPENSILFEKPRQVRIDKKNYCVNSEKNYKKSPAAEQITMLMAEHFNESGLFEETFYNQNEQSGYYLTGTLNSFYGKQKFSKGAAVGMQFGLIGALATSDIKTPAEIVLEIADLKLFKKDGTLVKDFGTFYREYNEDMHVDGACWCIFWNVNIMLKDFNSRLTEKIRTELAGVKL